MGMRLIFISKPSCIFERIFFLIPQLRTSSVQLHVNMMLSSIYACIVKTDSTMKEMVNVYFVSHCVQTKYTFSTYLMLLHMVVHSFCLNQVLPHLLNIHNVFVSFFILHLCVC